MTYLFDTDTLIYLIRGMKVVAPKNAGDRELHDRAGRIFTRCRDSAAGGDVLALSSISVAELEFGARCSGNYEHEIAAVEKILSPFLIVEFDGRECARHYGMVRHQLESAGIPIGSMDLLIAAHARATESVLVTNNRTHFRRVNGLQIESWV